VCVCAAATAAGPQSTHPGPYFLSTPHPHLQVGGLQHVHGTGGHAAGVCVPAPHPLHQAVLPTEFL